MKSRATPLDRTDRSLRSAVVAIALAAAGCGGRPSQPTPPPSGTPKPLGGSSALELFPALSPFGNELATAVMSNGKLEIHIRPLQGGPGRPLTRDGKNNVHPAWSPDGTLIAFHSKDRGGLWVAPAAGGKSRLLAAFGSRPSFSPDGKRVAFQSTPLTDVAATAAPGLSPSTIWIVGAGGGSALSVTTAGNPRGGHGAPTWSPDGSRLYFVTSEPRLSQAEIWSVQPDGADLVRLHAGTRLYEPRVSPDGRTLWYGGQNEQGTYALYRLPLGDGGRTVTGPAEAATALHADVPRSPSFSADGKKVAWSELTTTASIWSVTIDPDAALPTGPPSQLTAGDGRATWPIFSPDGGTIAFGWNPPGGSNDVWLMDADGGRQRAIIEGPAVEYANDFYPDGKRLLCFSDREGGKFSGYEFDIATKAFRKLPIDLSDAISIRLSPDGKRIAYHSKRDSITINTWMADLSTRTQQKLTFDREFVGYPCWSPDGRELALEVRRGDDIFIGVMPSAGGTPELLNEKRGLSWAFTYSPDGRRIAFAGYREDTWNLWWIDRKTREEKRLTDNTRLDVYIRFPYWSPKGDRIVYEQAETHGQVYLLSGGLPAPAAP
ncbi:MAG: PD40 domain-containing protein [Holophagales bacterium]|nr:PD40 domain-containing protein [Holophagales bacterium]